MLRRIDLLLDFASDAHAPLLVLPAGEKNEHRRSTPDLADGSRAEPCCSPRERRGVRVAVEAPYFGRPIDRVALVMEFLEELDPSIELAFDVSHIEAADESVTGAWDLPAQRVASSISGMRPRRHPPGHRQGQSRLRGVFEALAATGYLGDLVLELETRDSPFASKEEEVVAATAYLDSRRATWKR